MKAVMLSIRPKWCELITSGKKTIEGRKTRAKIDIPFKCYIYQSGKALTKTLITQICKGKFKQCFGYSWCYVEEMKK